MEATTREIAFLIEKLIDAGLDPLRREGIHTDAAARRVLRCSCSFITNCCFLDVVSLMPSFSAARLQMIRGDLSIALP